MAEIPEFPDQGKENERGAALSLKGMYKDYFLDYASYVILERAVPSVDDGLKPVQRRILHAMKEMDDGRFNKVANIIGQTMQYHPHGDASIGDALVNLGQKDLLIDCQGNWGDIRTGDSAAASRYIEARLTKFALEVVFNGQTTDWQLSYDGRKKEPLALPVKFPLLLAQGAEGIAVGLSTRILPHNFIELIEASVKILEGKDFVIYPDFATGGAVDVSDYNEGKRGGRIKSRATLEVVDKKWIVVRELPFGMTTSALIDSVVKAAEKGKIKIKQITDNTAKDVEIVIELVPGTSPDLAVDALFAFTGCEVSIAPNACVIIADKPHFLGVHDMLRLSTARTKDLLRQELEIRQGELEEKLHFASLEKIFIEQRIYRDIEVCETWEAVMTAIDTGLRRYVRVPGEAAVGKDTRLVLLRDITSEDIVRLTEIRIKRISKFNTFKAEEEIARLLEELSQVKHHLAHLTDFAIAYFRDLLAKYGKGRERKTKIQTFDTIQATEVVAVNSKLFVNRKEGFIGWGLKKDEFVTDCSDIDDIIVFRKDGKFQVSRIAEKIFVGKEIIHVAVWKKSDEMTTYNLVYLNGENGVSYAKRFNVTAITRDKEYDLIQGNERSKLWYFSANPNGEAETIQIQLSPNCRAKIKQFPFDFADLQIKGRSSQGNIVTRYPVRKIGLLAQGKSTLGARKIWMDEISGQLNGDGRGKLLGEFDTGDYVLAIYKNGTYEMNDLESYKKYDPAELVHIGKYDPEQVVNVVYYDGQKGWTMVKRFKIETSSLEQRFSFLTDHPDSRLLFASVKLAPRVKYAMRIKSKRMEGELDIADFISVKGWKAVGNRLSDQRVSGVEELDLPEIDISDGARALLEGESEQGSLF